MTKTQASPGTLQRTLETTKAEEEAQSSQAAWKGAPVEAAGKKTLQPAELPLGWPVCSWFPALSAVTCARCVLGGVG